MDKKVLEGSDLILSLGNKALGYSTGCKITTSTETGERQTKEASAGKWKEKYVKSFSEAISADGFVLSDGGADSPTYDQLKAMQLSGDPVDVAYSVRKTDTREGDATKGYTGKYLITSLELDAQSGDDSKYSLNLENCGAIKQVASGLTTVEEEEG